MNTDRRGEGEGEGEGPTWAAADLMNREGRSTLRM